MNRILHVAFVISLLLVASIVVDAIVFPSPRRLITLAYMSVVFTLICIQQWYNHRPPERRSRSLQWFLFIVQIVFMLVFDVHLLSF
ncbi:MAG: hypothetical protein H0U76_22075 [Ktedonobacteraceae bacterium]|nr:hypothetical protein [Ktedonobacteraceae bacterium]